MINKKIKPKPGIIRSLNVPKILLQKQLNFKNPTLYLPIWTYLYICVLLISLWITFEFNRIFYTSLIVNVHKITQ